MLWVLKKLVIFVIVTALAFAGLTHKQPHLKQDAINLVALKIMPHSMSIHHKDLKTAKNPNGDGIFVYTKKRDGRGIERKALWLVFENEIFPLNSTAKELTPELKWPEELMPTDWQITGLNLYSFHKPMQWIFG